MAVSAITNAFAGKSAAPATSGSGWWEPILNIGANILGNVAGAALANDGIDDQNDAVRDANNASIALNRDVFNTNLALAKPFYQGSGNAFNMLANIYGMPAQDFSFPTVSNSGGSYGANGASAANNWGAGQPVAGHSGGGGPNAFTGAAGAVAGNMFGGPIGGLIGSTIGGLFRNGGDNWKTIATGAPEGYDYDAYWAANPDLAADPKGWSKPDVQALFGGNRNAYIHWFANKSPDRAPLQKVAAPAGGGAGAGSGAAQQPLGDPLELFWNSPDGKLATNQFLTIDNPAIKGAFATAGKLNSGAQLKALADRGQAMAGNAFNGYRGGLERMAGYGQTATSQAQNAGNAFANNVSPTIQNNGVAAGQAAAARNNNWVNAFKNSTTGVYDYAKGAGWL